MGQQTIHVPSFVILIILLFPKKRKIGILPAMNVFDLIVLAVLVALTLRGIWKGMVSQIVSVASFFVCWVVASRFGSLIAPTIPVEAPWNQVLAMGILFVITLIAIRFAYAALEKLIKHWHLAKLNSLLGGVLGFTKGLLLCMIITFFSVMVSETSRGIVFTSTTGFHIVQLITGISVFVPKDSYEFVHSQLAQFQNKVDQAVPGQTPDTFLVQSSETVQQMRAQLEHTKTTTETLARSGSLLSAISNWWNGSKGDATDSSAETLSLTAQTTEKNEQSLLPAVPYMPPLTQSQPVQTYTAPQPAFSQSAAPEDFFVRQPESSPPPVVTPLTPLLPSMPEVSVPVPQVSAPLSTLAPLTELLPIPSELEHQLLPLSATPHHIGSDQLLHNSTQTTNPSNSARLFQPR